VGEKRNVHRVLLGYPEGKQQLGRNKLGRWIILKERNGMGRHGHVSSGFRIGMIDRLL